MEDGFARLEPIMMRRPSGVQSPRLFVSFPPFVSRRSPVPSGRTTKICVFMPPPGATDSAIHLPSGDQTTRPTGSVPFVICRGVPPVTAVTHACGTPVQSATNASSVPSGENVGDEARPIFAMRVTRSTSSGWLALWASPARATSMHSIT
jgi:hypothetical protein